MWTTTAGMHICHNLLTKHYQPNVSAQDCSEQSCAICSRHGSNLPSFLFCPLFANCSVIKGLHTALSPQDCTLLCCHRTGSAVG